MCLLQVQRNVITNTTKSKKSMESEVLKYAEVKNIVNGIEEFVKKNGPEEHEYEAFTSLMRKIGELKKQGLLSNTNVIELHKKFGEAMTSTKTLQGQVKVKPYGYAGDFDIIDKIYTNYRTPSEHLVKWDCYFQNQAAPKAVRNRKEYFKTILGTKKQNIKVLSIVGGPCRDIIEYLNDNPSTNMVFHCLEFDPNAVKHAKKLIAEFSVTNKNIKFIIENIYKFEPTETYDLIWASGVFDYLDAKAFAGSVKKLLSCLNQSGELVLGNFHPNNPSRDYMDFGFWHLNYRTEQDLLDIIKLLGLNEENISIKSEEEGINLFLHIKK